MKSAALETNSERKKYRFHAVCQACGDRLYYHAAVKDAAGKVLIPAGMRCNCQPSAKDPVGQSYEAAKAEARRLRRQGLLRGKGKRKNGFVPNELELQQIAEERAGMYD